MAKFPADKQERIKRLLLEGKPPAEVAERVGISIATAERYQQYWTPEIREAIDRKMVPTLKAAIKAAKRK
jgi:hypothetical protein